MMVRRASSLAASAVLHKETSAKPKPLVILAGWLGCKERSLRRYEELYRNNGCQVLTTIAPPSLIVETVVGSDTLREKPPPGWPAAKSLGKSEAEIETMDDFAWNLLGKIHNQYDGTPFLFHAFSNGGCFLWERVRRILGLDTDSSANNEQLDVLSSLRREFAGGVFDSCPSGELHNLGLALANCSWQTQVDMILRHGISLQIPYLRSRHIQQKLSSRSNSYISSLRSDPWETPQLYLFSMDDPLSSPKALEQLVDHRRKLLGPDRLFCHKWESSRHCAHLLDHPQDYKLAIENFLQQTLQQQSMRSRL